MISVQKTIISKFKNNLALFLAGGARPPHPHARVQGAAADEGHLDHQRGAIQVGVNHFLIMKQDFSRVTHI